MSVFFTLFRACLRPHKVAGFQYGSLLVCIRFCSQSQSYAKAVET